MYASMHIHERVFLKLEEGQNKMDSGKTFTSPGKVGVQQQ